MADKEREDKQRVGHDSTTIPGGEKDLRRGEPGRTPSKAEGDRETVEADLREKGME